jgi:DNA-binding NarL/FixJ family response regulator
MRRILFVDDEPRILDGLRRMLRGQRQEWEMVFALGGSAALSELERAPFDVVVTDMRMPGMDGVQLLLEATRIRPSAVRVVLSGQTERAQAVRAAGVAHQFIVKPSSSEAVRAVIDRVCCVRDQLPEEELRAVAGALRIVPVLPANFDTLRAALHGPDPSQESLARIIGADPGLTAKVLQLVNSAFFGAPREVGDVAAGVALLDPGLLREILDSGEVLAPLDAAAVDGLPECPEGASTAEVLRGFGPLVMRGAERRDPARAARIGAYLLGLWNLPVALVASTRAT